MPNRLRAVDLKSRTSRKSLLPRREPYWQRISAGFFIGYRVMALGSGNWIARLRKNDNKQKYHALGAFDLFDNAVKAANTWRIQFDAGVSDTKQSVTEICKNYVADLKVRKSENSGKDAEGRFSRLVYNSDLGSVRVDRLTPTLIRDWLNAQVAEPDDEDENEAETIRKSKDSANRNLRTLKAALNKARRDHLISSDHAWKDVNQFEKVSRSREVILSTKQRGNLLENCSPPFAKFVRGLLLTAARPGELAKAKLLDFDSEQGTIGLTGKTGHRLVTLSSATIEFFKAQCKGKDSRKHIFLDTYGRPWNKDSWKQEFRESADAANITSDFVVYSLRHTSISEMLVAGLSIGVVALLAGTSPEMIGKHYAHILHNQTRTTLNLANLL